MRLKFQAYVPLYCDCRLPESCDNLVEYDHHGFIISVSVTIIVKIDFVKIVSKFKLLSLSLVL